MHQDGVGLRLSQKLGGDLVIGKIPAALLALGLLPHTGPDIAVDHISPLYGSLRAFGNDQSRFARGGDLPRNAHDLVPNLITLGGGKFEIASGQSAS